MAVCDSPNEIIVTSDVFSASELLPPSPSPSASTDIFESPVPPLSSTISGPAKSPDEAIYHERLFRHFHGYIWTEKVKDTLSWAWDYGYDIQNMKKRIWVCHQCIIQNNPKPRSIAWKGLQNAMDHPFESHRIRAPEGKTKSQKQIHSERNSQQPAVATIVTKLGLDITQPREQLLANTYIKYFDRSQFQRLLVEWVIASNQSFEVVEDDRLRAIFSYLNPSVEVQKALLAPVTNEYANVCVEQVRKIRCDGLPEGCSPCAQQYLECYITDRVTRRTERRGYLQELEREKKDMMTRLCDLEKLLEYKGVQVRLQQWTPPYGLSTPLDPDNDPRKDQWTKFFSLWVKDASYQAEKSLKEYSTTQQASSLETADPSIADARLGGTSLNAPDVDGPLPGVPNNTPLYDKSLQSFVNSVSKVNQPASQFASHHQHNLDVAIKQEEFGSGVYRRPPFRSKSTTSSPMVNRTEKLRIHPAPGMEKVPYYNHSMTAHPQMGYAGFTQSTFSIPTSAPSSVQSSHISAVIEGSANHQHLHTTSAEASAAAAQMNRTVHTPPNNSPQAVTAAHHRVVAYNSPQQAAVVQPYHHQQQQEELAPAEWMNSCSGPANGMLTAQQVPNGAEPFHPTTPTHSWHWAARSGSGDQGGGRVEGGA